MTMYLLYVDLIDDKEAIGIFDREHIRKAYLHARKESPYDLTSWRLRIKKFKLNDSCMEGVHM